METSAPMEDAKSHQQQFYESLAEWTKYDKHEYKYLKQNIAYAMFGFPLSDQEVYNENNITEASDVTNVLCYHSETEKLINEMYEKICELGDGQVAHNTIYYGIIYNVILIPTKKNGSQSVKLHSVPIFKVKRKLRKSTPGLVLSSYTVGYIDVNGRTYNSWKDYVTCNTLPKCIMVLPKDGYYQPDESCEITEEKSTVWLERIKSPAWSTTKSVLARGDLASTIVGIAGMTAGVASIFTPVGPVLLTGAALASGASSLWTLARSSQVLIDRNLHKESINPRKDNAAFSAWLGVGGSVAGLATTGATAAITNATRQGKNISNISKFAFNTLVVGNVTVNGIGVGSNAYSLYGKYKNGDDITYFEVFSFASHILFFGNAVINLQFANSLIKSTQGQYMDEYTATIRTKRLRKQFNRVKRKAAASGKTETAENAESITYINRKKSFNRKLQTSDTVKISPVEVQNGTISVYGVKLLDTGTFKTILKTLIQLEASNSSQNSSSTAQGDTHTNNKMFCTLKDLLLMLLEKFYPNYSKTNDIDKFNKTLADMKDEKHACNILPVIFKVAVALLRESNSSQKLLSNALHFVWNYVKENLKNICKNMFPTIKDETMQEVLNMVLQVFLEYMDQIVQQLLSTFLMYMRNLTGT